MYSITETTTAKLEALLLLSSKQSAYFGKDLRKARIATQFIGQGSYSSSTAAYAKATGPLANTGNYTKTDIVFISAEGARTGRFKLISGQPNGHYRNLLLAMAARASFIIDKPVDRNRPYNVGERQIATFLSNHGYVERTPGRFTPEDNE